MGGKKKRRRSDRAQRPKMRSPGRPTAGREHRQEFWREIARGTSTEAAAVSVGISPAVKRTVSGLLKLLYPHDDYDKEAVRECLEYALEVRRRRCCRCCVPPVVAR
jgi:hypothetical protein